MIFFFFARVVKLAIVWFLHTCIFAEYFLWEYPLKYARVIRKKARFFFVLRKKIDFESWHVFRKDRLLQHQPFIFTFFPSLVAPISFFL